MILIGLSCAWAGAAEPDYEKLANAIGRAENSTKYPYGIISINTHGDKVLARRICINTCKNNYVRWKKAGSKGDYLTFLSNRYCPIGAGNDPKGLNRNWIKNVRFYLDGPANSPRTR